MSSTNRIRRLEVPWAQELHTELCKWADSIKEQPNVIGRKFSITDVSEIFPQNIAQMLNRFDLGLDKIRGFVIPANVRRAIGPHKDTNTDERCFALNVMLRGHLRVNIHEDADCMPVRSEQPGGGISYIATEPPSESMIVGAGDIFMMDTFYIHSADSLGKEQVLLASFVPSDQYSFQEAMTRVKLE